MNDVPGHMTRRWSLADLDFSQIDTERTRERDDLFLLICSASFVESASETYTHNLVEHFADDKVLRPWLIGQWEAEELQHGLALKTYIRNVWPDFDWEAGYANFQAEYGRLCTVAELEPKRGLELAARCIVEMGTTTYYQALGAACEEPVLRDLVARIRTDEVLHYKHFYGHFLRYRKLDALSRRQVFAALARRVAELRQSDAEIALRHAASGLPAERGTQFKSRQQQAVAIVRNQYPVELAVRMALKPLRLNMGVQRCIESPLSKLARWALLH
jgi:hypothetical protein